MRTNRPSPSPKGEVSRNKVGVTEVAPSSYSITINASRLHREDGINLARFLAPIT